MSSNTNNVRVELTEIYIQKSGLKTVWEGVDPFTVFITLPGAKKLKRTSPKRVLATNSFNVHFFGLYDPLEFIEMVKQLPTFNPYKYQIWVDDVTVYRLSTVHRAELASKEHNVNGWNHIPIRVSKIPIKYIPGVRKTLPGEYIF